MTTTSQRRQRLAGFLLAFAGLASLAAVTGCSASPQAAASPAAATTGTVTPAAPATASSSPGTSAPSAPAASPATPVASATPSASASVPTLGQPAGVFAEGAGFGQVRPARIFNGGDPSGLVTGVTWQSWGGARATGTGTTVYVGPGQSVATGTEETATVVAFHLGTCDGKLMYRALEWYFPQHGQKFSAAHYENICTGTYVPTS